MAASPDDTRSHGNGEVCAGRETHRAWTPFLREVALHCPQDKRQLANMYFGFFSHSLGTFAAQRLQLSHTAVREGILAFCFDRGQRKMSILVFE